MEHLQLSSFESRYVSCTMVELEEVPSEKDAPFEAPEPARRPLDADVDALLGAGSADATPQVRRLVAALCIKNWTELEESGELEPGVVRELQRFLLIVANQARLLQFIRLHNH